MGYKPSAIARSLVTRKTQTIGVIVSSIGDPFNGQVVNGIEEVAHQNGYSLMLANARTDPDRVISVVRSFQERRVEGILVTASRVGALYTPLISEMQVPIVLLNNRQEGKFVHSVTIDNFKAGCQATRHLIELGHTRISYIGDRLGFQSNIERFAGYQQALSEAGITFRPELVAHGDGRPKGGMQAMCNLLATPERPTAVFCYNDMSSLGALHAAKSRQVRVPKDLSVVGFDDMFFAPYLQPPLTTIRQPKCGMGKRAMELLLDLLAGKKPEKVVMIQGKLLVRSSTAPPEGKK
jgi:LacI family transcriptional regulator/LacI family repressor for deo operon, udp, cdd, tsx, nupC, and nupG